MIGNAMTASAVALNRLGDEMRDDAPRIEATLDRREALDGAWVITDQAVPAAPVIIDRTA